MTKNFFIGIEKKEFWFWVNPMDSLLRHNMGRIGYASSNLLLLESSCAEDNLLFIPNPEYKGGISPYQNNIIKRIRAEYWLEIYRPEQYPSRTQALYLCNSRDDANKYAEIHKEHIKNRILINGIPSEHPIPRYSIHDSGWFDFLCENASFDEETIKFCANAFWSGLTVESQQLKCWGKSWTQQPTIEVLFYGNLKISIESKREIVNFTGENFDQPNSQNVNV